VKFTLLKRDFTDEVTPPALDYRVNLYSHAAVGGPKEATITARGEGAELFRLANHLRAPVEITNEAGECVWWGYVHKVDVSAGRFRFGVDLTTMANRVRVAYIVENERQTTDWSADAASVADYGTKEILLSRADGTPNDALSHRDTYLARAKDPIPTMRFAGAVPGEAVITCRGWLDTLDWVYYENLTGKEAYEVTGDGGREIGEDDRPILAQSFQIAASVAWVANAIWLRPWWQGEEQPGDNLVVSLKSDSGGNPGATLASGQIAGANVGSYAEWTEFTLNTAVTLEPATTYWIHVARSGAVALDNYYMVDTNLAAGYSRGLLKLYNTSLSAWVENDYAFWGDLLFRVVGTTATTAQMATLVESCGQFLSGTILEAASGIDSNPYRDGDSAGLYELKKLLEAGTSNNRRLLVEVTRARDLRVYEEPAMPAGAAALQLDAAGVLQAAGRTHFDASLCPVGVWVHLVDVIPASVDLSLLSDPTLFLVEEASYSPATGEYRVLRTRDQLDLFDIGGTTQG
jgi:hypothetical protein